jgi:hypothetical protein
VGKTKATALLSLAERRARYVPDRTVSSLEKTSATRTSPATLVEKLK